MTTEQPYFMVKVTRCGECPHFHKHSIQCLRAGHPFWMGSGRKLADENLKGLTPSCPMWPQRVQQEKKDV